MISFENFAEGIHCEGAMASWLVRSSPYRAFRVRVPFRGQRVAFLGKTLNCLVRLSTQVYTEMSTGELNAEGKSVMD